LAKLNNIILKLCRLLLNIQVRFLGLVRINLEKDLIIDEILNRFSIAILLEHAIDECKVENLIFEVVIDRILILAHDTWWLLG
jgi:hypothetical protein